MLAIAEKKINRRSFLSGITAFSTLALADTKVQEYNTANRHYMNKPKKPLWIDTHNHVSDIMSNGQKNERMLEDLLNVLDRCDADLKLIISTDGKYVNQMMSDPGAILTANRMIYDLCRRAPGRLYGSCMVNPNFPDESLKVMKTCFEEWGFVQFGELKPYQLKYRMSDASTEKLARQAARYDVPVQVHLGTWWCKNSKPGVDTGGDGMNQMSAFLNLAERVPEAKYILAHSIGGRGPNPANCVSMANTYLDIIKGLFNRYPENFWMEICNFQCPAVKRALSEVPVTRLISGTDWSTRTGPPFKSYGTLFGFQEKDNPFPPNVSTFVEFLKEAGASDSDIERIGYMNVTELCKLS